MLFLDRSQLADYRAALIGVWNAASGGLLPLAQPLWLQNVENDPRYQDGDCIVAEARGEVAGFAITRMLTQGEVAGNSGMEGYLTRGHIMALAVAPDHQQQGVGSALLQAAEESLIKRGATSIALWGPPGHLVPGPLADHGDPDFWRRRGYHGGGASVDLRRTLDDWTAPAPPPKVASGEYSYRQAQAGEEEAIDEFLSRAFPDRWRYDIAHFFKRGYKPECVTILLDAQDVIQGFQCNYHANSGYIGAGAYWYPIMREGVWGGIGPLGVSESVRGGGLGLGLVAAGVQYLYEQGVRDCGIDWTGHIDFYGKLGFLPWKHWLTYQKDLEKDER